MNAGLSPVAGHVSSAVGFGCSALLGPNSRLQALHLLGSAHNAGINHFDVARSYGSGEAESVLGEFLRGRRDQVTVTSKFGIVAAGGIVRRGPVLSLARRAMRVSPRLRRVLGRGGAVLVKRRAFSVEDARSSLEATLRALATDYIDVYLLHDCTPDDCHGDDLLAFLSDCVDAGKVRRLGVGTDAESAEAIVRLAPELARVVQVEHSAARQTVSRLSNGDGRVVIAHGALSPHSQISEHLRDATERRRWSHELDADAGNPPTLAALLLSYALATNGRGPVLFSSTRPEHIAQNASVAREQPFTHEQLERFGELVTGIARCG